MLVVDVVKCILGMPEALVVLVGDVAHFVTTKVPLLMECSTSFGDCMHCREVRQGTLVLRASL